LAIARFNDRIIINDDRVIIKRETLLLYRLCGWLARRLGNLAQGAIEDAFAIVGFHLFGGFLELVDLSFVFCHGQSYY